MLMLNFREGDSFTIKLPDGTEGHALLTKITDKVARFAFSIPDEIIINRDTTGAVRAFREHKT